MKKITLLLAGALFLLLRFALLANDGPANATKAPEPIPKSVVEFIRAKDRLLVELATERYAAHSNRNETWFFTVHDGSSVRKYRDTNYVLVSLPALDPEDRIAMRGYATSYNAHNVAAADNKVKEGNYAEARKMYQILLRFECPDMDGLLRPAIEKRLVYLEKLQKGENTEDNRKEFLKLSVEYASLLNLSDIENAVPMVVTNLLEVSNR